jgi:hypothetical protein
VLDYAPPNPVQNVKKWVLRILLMLVCGVIGAIIANFAQPVSCTSVGYLQLAPGSMTVASRAQAQQNHAAAIRAGASAAVATIGGLSPQQLATGLLIRPVPDTALIVVGFTSSNAARARAVTRAVMNRYCATAPGVMVAVSPGLPTPRRSPLFAITGFMFGVALVTIAIAVRCRRGPFIGSHAAPPAWKN